MTQTLATRVAQIRDLAPDVKAFELRAVNGEVLPPFTAGAHVDIHLPGGLVRQYSLVNAEDERDRYVVAVHRARNGRGGSIAMHALQVGAALKVSPPRNLFPLEPDDAPVLLLAAGIGITPLLSMARALHRSGRPFSLIYSVRHRTGAPFVDDLRVEDYAAAVRIHETRSVGNGRLDFRSLAKQAGGGSRVYACGPAGFIADVESAFATRSDVMVRSESFNAATLSGVAFNVVLNRCGRSFIVPENTSILEEMRRLGHDPEASCEQGVCGACLTNVVSGDIDHRDHLLTPAERALGAKMAICVSRGRPGTTLVLDV